MAVAGAVGVSVGGDGFDGHDAAVGDLALDVFKLDRGVVDLEFIPQGDFDLFEDQGAFRWRNIGDRDVGGKGVGLRAEAPDVKVVDVFDP